MEKTTFKRVLTVSICFIVFIYLMYLFYSANFSVVKTETVSLVTVADSIYANGYAVRNETLITNNTKGIVSYEYEGNRKVAVGGVIARVYSNEQDAKNYRQMDRIQKQIGLFQRLNKSSKRETVGLESIQGRIGADIVDINKNIVNGNILDLAEKSDNLKYALNESKIILGEVLNYTDKINSLSKSYDAIKSVTGNAIAEIKAPVSGYFTTVTDGYEKKYNYAKVTSTTLGQAKKELEYKPDAAPDSVIGKIVSDLNWYLICPVKKEDSLAISQNLGLSQIKVNMPYATTQSVPVEVAAMNQKRKTDDGALVLQCNYMSPVLSSLRREELKIDIRNYEGLKISKSALHEETVTRTVTDSDGNKKDESKKVKGVYVINGNIMKFKEVIIEYSGEDYYICKQAPDKNELFSSGTVALYDRVVIGGTDLYDGKSARA